MLHNSFLGYEIIHHVDFCNSPKSLAIIFQIVKGFCWFFDKKVIFVITM